MTIVLENLLMQGLSESERLEIANGYVAVLERRLAEYALEQKCPFTIDVEIVDVRPGCVEVKLKIVLTIVSILAAGMSAAAKWPEVRKVIPIIAEDVGNFYRCRIKHEQSAICVTQARDLNISKHLYQVKQGDTLSRIVSEEWRFSQQQIFRAMIATVQLNPDAFVDGDMNQLKAGAHLARPTDKMVEAAPRS